MPNTNKDNLRDLLSLCAEIISKYSQHMNKLESVNKLKTWDNFVDQVDVLSHVLNDPDRCPECGSTYWDYANIGFTNAVTCLHCGSIRMKKE